MQRRTSAAKRQKATRGWRKFHNGKFYVMHFSQILVQQIKEDEIGKACGMYGDMRNMQNVSLKIGKESKGPG